MLKRDLYAVLHLVLATILTTVHKDITKNSTSYKKFLETLNARVFAAESEKEIRIAINEIKFYQTPIDNAVLANLMWKARKSFYEKNVVSDDDASDDEGETEADSEGEIDNSDSNSEIPKPLAKPKRKPKSKD